MWWDTTLRRTGVRAIAMSGRQPGPWILPPSGNAVRVAFPASDDATYITAANPAVDRGRPVKKESE